MRSHGGDQLADHRHSATSPTQDSGSVSTPLVIIGAGGFGREVLDVVEAHNALDGRWDFLGFVDDGSPDMGLLDRRAAKLLGPVAVMADIDARYVIGIGSGAARRSIDEKMTALGRTPATLVHPAATLGSDVELGPGCIVCAQAGITTHVRLGRHADVHVGSAVGHDTVLEPYASVFPGASVGGNVLLESGATVGTGAAIIQGLVVGRDATVGAGAAVVRDVPAGATVVGVPAVQLEN